MSQDHTIDARAGVDLYLTQVNDEINSFLDQEISHWDAIDSSITPPLTALNEFISGKGKRLRPSFCYLGYIASSGDGKDPSIVNAGCALELLHNFALVHDDFMDRADTRRGKPTVHRYLENLYGSREYSGDIEHFSQSVAILAGDFAFTYADRFAYKLPQRCHEIYDRAKVELFAGQQMDLDASYRKAITKQHISRIAQYKSGKYSIERPLHIGAVLARQDAPKELWENFGCPLGEAFQLRDDILGIFGDPRVTGKPVGDDIREGKFTLLIAEAVDRATPDERVLLDRRGSVEISSEDVDRIVGVIEDNGARKVVDARISELHNEAIVALGSIDMSDEARNLAVNLADYACWRES